MVRARPPRRTAAFRAGAFSDSLFVIKRGMDPSFEKRKEEHLSLSLKDRAESPASNGLDRVQLIHCALPELDFQDISLSRKFFGRLQKTPFFACSMTGGWGESKKLNLHLAKICEKRSWMMGAGSQRGQLTDPSKGKEWRDIREICPDLILLGNLGLSQVISTPVKEVEKLVESLKAQAMIVHTNPLQEALQKEGVPRFKGGLEALKNLTHSLSVPVILKETGCGFSEETLNRLEDSGLFAVDVGGLGGTHWGRIEGERLPEGDFRHGVGEVFSRWGVKTRDSLLYSGKRKRDFKIWAGGGFRSGLDGAKALALGAEAVGFGRPLLQALSRGPDELERVMARWEYELKVCLFCTGSADLESLKGKWKSRDEGL